jgi:hypothetical protein
LCGRYFNDECLNIEGCYLNYDSTTV